MLDDVYKTAVVLITDKYVNDETDFPAGSAAIALFGLLVSGTMGLIWRWHARNCVQHRDEVERLLAIARTDKH